jgi:hypothetical protein
MSAIRKALAEYHLARVCNHGNRRAPRLVSILLSRRRLSTLSVPSLVIGLNGRSSVHSVRRATSGTLRTSKLAIIDPAAHAETMRKCTRKPMRCTQRRIKVGVSR